MRRYDIDWIRVIAIGLLLIYHVSIGFQPWGMMIGFITNSKSWTALWIPMTLLNVMRIPLLFFVSGMGVYFAMRNRNWKQLLADRTWRILLPFVFGIFAIVPIHIFIIQYYYHLTPTYLPNPGHLWFLGNLVFYVIVLSPLFFYLKRNEEGHIVRWMQKGWSTPWGLVPVIVLFILEALIINPMPYELYAMTWHGFVLGLLAFFFGFCFVISGNHFWQMISTWKWLFLLIAVALFTLRTVLTYLKAPALMPVMVIESQCWIIAVFAFGYRYLNRPGKALTYLSQAAYPVYIIHMIFLYLSSAWIFPLEIGVPLQFVLVLLFTFAGCFATYELLIRRVKWIRPLFGLKR
jgi:glucan biosynthesis protein C